MSILAIGASENAVWVFNFAVLWGVTMSQEVNGSTKITSNNIAEVRRNEVIF